MGGQDLLIVHFFQEAVILNSIGFEEFSVSHLKGLTYRARYVLSLFTFEDVTDLRNKAVCTTASKAFGWARAVMKVILVIWSEETLKNKT